MTVILRCRQGHSWASNADGSPGRCPICGRNAQPLEAPPFFPGLEVLSPLASGVGGMGEVYRARELALDRVVVIKTIRRDRDDFPLRELFEREAPLAAKLDHPNILRIYGFNPEHTPPYFVMQYVHGLSADQATIGKGFVFIAELMEKVARALAYAHKHGIVHRDIKPENILVDASGEPFIADFGLAGRIGAAMEWALVGTPGYIAPESRANPSEIQPSTDIYALGATMYRLLTGSVPAEEKDVRLPQEIHPDVPEPLQRICLKAIERRLTDRYASASELADDLRRFLDGGEVYARPRRYETERRGRLRNLLTELEAWREQKLIDTAECDRLARPARALLDVASPFRQLSIRFPWETVAMRAGGCLVMVSTLLWASVYWPQLGRLQRIIALGLPALITATVGWTLRAWGSRANALILLNLSALLLPLFICVTLTELGWINHQQIDANEIFAPWSADLQTNTERSALSQESLSPTNLRITISMAILMAYGIIAARLTRSITFAVWATVGAYLTYGGVLFLLGMKEDLMNEHVARSLVRIGLLPPLTGIIAWWLGRRPGSRPFAMAAYAFVPLPMAAILSLLAWYGATEWLKAPPQWDNQSINIWWIIDGVIYFAFALWSYSSPRGFSRFWGPPLMLLAAVHFVAPLNLLLDRGLHLGYAGGVPVTTYEIASLVVAGALIIVGTRLRVQSLAIPGMWALAYFIWRATGRHFQDHLAWPLALDLIGASALALATSMLVWRSRGTHDPTV